MALSSPRSGDFANFCRLHLSDGVGLVSWMETVVSVPDSSLFLAIVSVVWF